MKKEHLLSAMNNVSDHYLLDARQPAAAAKKSIRPLRVVIIAACLCALLIGGAIAAEHLTSNPDVVLDYSNPITGEKKTGFYTVIEPAEDSPEATETPSASHNSPSGTVRSAGVPKLSESALSDEVLALASGYTNYYLTYTELDVATWEEAEAFLGIDLMDNFLLSQTQKINSRYPIDETAPHCYGSVYGAEGTIHGANLHAHYRLGNAAVKVTAQLYTEHSRIAKADMFMGHGFMDGTTLDTQLFISESGLRFKIVTATFPNGAISHYAQFSHRGAAFTVTASSGTNGAYSLSTLKEVLDAFQ